MCRQRLPTFRLCLRILARTMTMSRLKIVIATYQIVGNVLWSVPDVVWPDPFNSFGRCRATQFCGGRHRLLRQRVQLLHQGLPRNAHAILLSLLIAFTARVRVSLASTTRKAHTNEVQSQISSIGSRSSFSRSS